MTEYWENDPENDNILPTINECKIGYYGTDSKWATPIKFFPDAVYLDMTVFENLNLDMPDIVITSYSIHYTKLYDMSQRSLQTCCITHFTCIPKVNIQKVKNR